MYKCIDIGDIGEKFALHKNDAMILPCYQSVQVENKEVNTFTGIIQSGASEYNNGQ